MSEDPCEGYFNIFFDSLDAEENTYKKATLYIPEGTTEKYQAIDPWKRFKNIVEVQVTGIDDVNSGSTGDGAIDYTAPYDVYSFTGIKVDGKIDRLQSGMYIVRQGKTVVKLKI